MLDTLYTQDITFPTFTEYERIKNRSDKLKQPVFGSLVSFKQMSHD